MNNSEIANILRNELSRRLSANQSYSLRAFARSLKMDPSTLSKILNGQRRLGDRARAGIFNKLGLTTKPQISDYVQISDTEFEQMPEWYDTAILEQLNVTGFKATKESLAYVFGLNEIQVELALQRLQKLALIKISAAGTITDISAAQTSNISPQSTNFTKRNLQRQFLEKAIRSLDEDPLEDRDMTTITCAIDPIKIPEAKLLIKKFRRELGEFLTSGKKPKRTYNVSIALYPLSKSNKEKNK